MDSDNEMECVNEVLNVDFEGRSPDDSDISGIRLLLKQLFLQSGIDIFEMANQVVSQNYIGSVLHQIYDDECDDDDDDGDNENDDPIFGILTVINLTDKKHLNFVKELYSFVDQKCKENCNDEAKKFESILSDPNEKIGYLINERILAAPQVALPNFESLWKDLERANKKKMKYEFSKYLIIARGSIACSKKAKGKKSMKDATREFINPEDEVFLQNSLFSFDYSVKGQQDSLVEMTSSEQLLPDEREPIRTVMIVEAEKIPLIMNQIKELCE